MKNPTKILALLVLSLLLTGCFSQTKTPTPTISNEVLPVQISETQKEEKKPESTTPTPEKSTIKETKTTTKPDPKTDEITKELDSLIDELVGSQ